MKVTIKFRIKPILAKLIYAINWFIDLAYVENGTIFHRPVVFVMLIVILVGTFMASFGIGLHIYYFLF